MASFLNDFKDVTENTDLLLQWGPSDATEYPLQLQARILNKTSEYEVNTVEMIIASESHVASRKMVSSQIFHLTENHNSGPN